ncbi:prepilin peptidase [Candidatus Caldatribacterium saccharofermentans]|uniref:prepilin peptidase n=1 Tax=Candidatus Caldatribacterium saccharofermentans TaxID=1454753 RepID=UPI003D082145
MAFLFLPFLIILSIIAFIDLRSFRIPDPLVVVLFGLGALKMVLEGSYASSLSGFLALFGFFFLLHLFFPKGMGFGDVKLAGSIGLFLGLWLGVLSAFLAFISGGLVGVVLVVLRKKTLKDPLPFGPFLALGALLGLFFGERILSWYFGMFFP